MPVSTVKHTGRRLNYFTEINPLTHRWSADLSHRFSPIRTECDRTVGLTAMPVAQEWMYTLSQLISRFFFGPVTVNTAVLLLLSA